MDNRHNKGSYASLKEHQAALLKLLSELDRVCKALDIPYLLFAGTMLGAVRHKGFIPWDDDLDIIMARPDYDRFLKEAQSVLDGKGYFLQKEFSEHWPMFFSKLRLNDTACIEKFHPKDPDIHQGIYLDIFPCDSAYDSTFLRKLQFYASKVVIAKSLGKRGYETDSFKKKLFMGACRLLPMKPFLSFVKGKGKDSALVHSFLGGASSFQKNVYPASYIINRKEISFEGGLYPISSEYDGFLRILYGDYMRLPSPEERAVKCHAVLVDTENSYEMYRDLHKSMKFDTHTRSIR